MKYYTYRYEDYSGNKGEITVKAETQEEAWEKSHDYRVCHGEIHYLTFLHEDDEGEEKYYQKDNNAMGLLIGLMGAALGCTQLGMYGVKKNYLDALKNDEVKYLLGVNDKKNKN